MVLTEGEPLARAGLTEPEVAAHLAFVPHRELHGHGVSAATALLAVRAVYGALVVTERGTPIRYLTGGSGLAPGSVDLALEGCLLELDGRVVDTATAPHPLRWVAPAGWPPISARSER
ncbi:hypothetical protein [Amycolatopsis cihanbeyliensis]|uniref:Uncharacterized protein n=1 Tax=Amycolatopsis cihanbeyliensis TaxID=1128664 RepID=A0A542CUR8_AMYCI|nr:hypothetical protein [Amycolatopsis cihanbeyliensis]TQI94567.1 hypothetical protein FB471_6733 [Amycolatopsis cihanbeyliensis]